MVYLQEMIKCMIQQTTYTAIHRGELTLNPPKGGPVFIAAEVPLWGVGGSKPSACIAV